MLMRTHQLLQKLSFLAPLLSPETRMAVGLVFDGAVPDHAKIAAGIGLLLLSGVVAFMAYLRRNRITERPL